MISFCHLSQNVISSKVCGISLYADKLLLYSLSVFLLCSQASI